MIERAQQLAVIMARGESTRMGQSKGLCRLNDQGAPFVTRVTKLYCDLGIPTLLIVRPQDKVSYGEHVDNELVQIHSATGGADTAQTMKLALDWTESRKINPNWIWAHPVDLPLVAPQTIHELLTAAQEHPDSAWRPICDGTPGHPVLFPGTQLGKVLAQSSLDHSMSRVWRHAVAEGIVSSMQMLDVKDRGAITDFDTPEQLNAIPESKEPKS